MFPKKYYDLLFILIMGFGMSLLMTLIITYINTGMDDEYLDRFFKSMFSIDASNIKYLHTGANGLF